jgi:hypothetical protein
MNGEVLIVGYDENDGFPADTEIYDPAAGMFTSIGKATAPHDFAADVRLSNGMVLIAGGQLPGGSGTKPDSNGSEGACLGSKDGQPGTTVMRLIRSKNSHGISLFFVATVSSRTLVEIT